MRCTKSSICLLGVTNVVKINQQVLRSPHAPTLKGHHRFVKREREARTIVIRLMTLVC